MSQQSNTTSLNPPVAFPANMLDPALGVWRWIHRKGYLQGVFWAVMICLVSSLNDTLTKFAGGRLEGSQVGFFRFFFSMITLLPIMGYKYSQGLNTFTTSRLGFHSLRAVLGYGAIVCWSIGVAITPLSVTSLLAQTVPLFVLPMAVIFLREKVGWQRTMATLVGFIGILITMQSPDRSTSLLSFTELNIGAIWLIAAGLAFAASDILNKIMVGTKEHPLTMLFYFAVGTTLIGIIPVCFVWQTPTLQELFWLFCLGAGANLILYCLIKAFTATDVSALAPYRYVELIIASGFGFLLFSEIPTIMTLIGAAVIVPATFTIAIYEVRRSKSLSRA